MVLVPVLLDELHHRNTRDDMKRVRNREGRWSPMRAKHKRMCPWAIQLVATLLPAFGVSRPSFTPAILYPPLMAYHKGDDLDDDFVPDETVALSEDEGFGSLVGDHDDIGKLLSADEDEKEDVESPIERTQAPSEEKKRRRREKEKERKAKVRPLLLHRYSRVPDA